MEMPKSIKTISEQLSETVDIKYNPYLVRGFDYYTGTIFEIFSTDGENTRSIAGGGRYDKLIDTPAVGFGIGDCVISDVLKTANILPIKGNRKGIGIIFEEDSNGEILKLAKQLREQAIPVTLLGNIKDKKSQYTRADEFSLSFLLTVKEALALRDVEKQEDLPVASLEDVVHYYHEANSI